MSAAFTPGPWYVRDLTAKTMRELGWTGPSIDRILITNKTGPEIIRDEGDDCVIARIQFDHRPEELGEGNLADARLIAAAPELLKVLLRAQRALQPIADRVFNDNGDHTINTERFDASVYSDCYLAAKAISAALAKARGEQ